MPSRDRSHYQFITYGMVINLQKVVLVLEAITLEQMKEWIFPSEGDIFSTTI